MLCKNQLEREMRIIIQLMIRSNYIIQPLPFEQFGLFRKKQKKAKFLKSIDKQIIFAMTKANYLSFNGAYYSITDIAKIWIDNFLYFIEIKPDDSSQRPLSDGSHMTENKKSTQIFNEKAILIGELGLSASPIFKLYNRQKSNANGYLKIWHLQAGQKIFEIYTDSKLTPNITTNTQRLMAGPQKHYMGNNTENISNKCESARKILYAILKYLGDDFAAVIVEICILGNGLVMVEKMLGWPARSAKLLLTLALDRLAEYLHLKPAQSNEGKYISWAKNS